MFTSIIAFFGSIIAAIGSLPVWAIVLIALAIAGVVGALALGTLLILALIAGGIAVAVGTPIAVVVGLILNYVFGGPDVLGWLWSQIEGILDWILSFLGGIG